MRRLLYASLKMRQKSDMRPEVVGYLDIRKIAHRCGISNEHQATPEEQKHWQVMEEWKKMVDF